MQEILELERNHNKEMIQHKIAIAKHKNREALLNTGISIINMQTTAIVMGMFAEVCKE